MKNVDGNGSMDEVLYGTDGSRTVFLPRATAEWLAAVWDALLSSTWGELRSRMSGLGEDARTVSAIVDEVAN